jgi:hypothetical protein
MGSRFGYLFIRWFTVLLVLFTGIVKIQPVLAQSNIIDVVVHYVEGAPSETDVSYEVKAFVSVVDCSSPINDLKVEDFTLTEDSQKVEIKSASLADEPINLVLLMDTSGSMSGQGITAPKAAASSLLRLAAKTVFPLLPSMTAPTLIDFTTDHARANKIALIDATRPGDLFV